MFFLRLVALVTIAMAPSVRSFGSGVIDAFTFKPIEKYVEERGYIIQKHVIETEDGFKLTYHRIPHGKLGPDHGHGHPVLLAHGILQSSALYLAMDDGLAYLLADSGFDVWIMNARGNTHSRKHKKYSPTWSKKFWNFSFHEMGTKDLPAAINHILEVTKRQSLSYVGFSMGTTMFWVLADSWGAKYMDRVDTMVAIAPMARPSGMSILHKPKMYKTLSIALKTFNELHSYEVRPFRPTEGLLVRAACSKGENTWICSKMLAGLVGLYPDTIHYTDTYASTQYMPAGTSVKNVQHFLQTGKKGKFQQFDYGENGNIDKYKSPTPPMYDLSKVTCPVFFISSDKDDFSVREDVTWLATQLPEYPQMLFSEEVKDFQHLDYFYSKNVKGSLYKPLVSFITERTENLPQ